MKAARVRLVDLGLHEDFERSAALAQTIVGSLVARRGAAPMAEVELVRSRDSWVVAKSRS